MLVHGWSEHFSWDKKYQKSKEVFIVESRGEKQQKSKGQIAAREKKSHPKS